MTRISSALAGSASKKPYLQHIYFITSMVFFIYYFQQIQQLVDEAVKPLNFNEDIWSTNDSLMLVILHRFVSDEATGITLKGGADFKRKDITVSFFFISKLQRGQ